MATQILVSAVAIGLLLAEAACESPAVLGRAAGNVPGGSVMFAMRLAAPAAAASHYRRYGGPSAMVGGARYYYDPAAHVYSGYEAHVRASGNGQFTIMLEPLGIPLEELTGGKLQGYRPKPPPRLPQPQMIREGEPLDIDLLVTSAGERLFDRIRFYSAQ